MSYATKHNQGGFTLIEILVSVAIFTVVMVIALGALLALSEADRKAEALNTAINNLSAAMDSMSRNIRTGTNFHCGSGALTSPADCASSPGGSQFAYLAADGATETSYCLSNPGVTNACNTSTTCSTGACTILRSTNDGVTWLPMTSPDIFITNLTFYVIGSARAPTDTTQPKVTILISGYVPTGVTQKSVFNLETSITQRLYDE